ncbi:MAG: hypothetical protein LBL79_14850 [Prevotella sp.]|jgi:hypothetical protein|nr:hypothetical protein [Prevotella sp.]
MKQIINKLLAAISAVVLICLLSCNEDKGNYDYADINLLDSINRINSIYYAELGDTLIITPRLVFSHGDDKGEYTYKWYYATPEGGWTQLQEGLTFKQEVAPPIGRDVTLLFEARNTQTDISYRKAFSLTLSPSLKGYLALCEAENGFEIDVVSFSQSKQKFSLLKNVLAKTESTIPRNGVKPIDIATSATWSINGAPTANKPDGSRYAVWLLTDQYTTRLSSIDFSWSPDYDIEASVEKSSYLDTAYIQKGKRIIAKKIKVTDSEGRKTWMYHVNDAGEGNWFLYQFFIPARYFANPINVAPVIESGKRWPKGPRFEPSPYLSVNSYFSSVFYDKTAHSFKYGILAYSSTSTNTFANAFFADNFGTEPAGGAFSFSDPDYEDCLYMDETLRLLTAPDGCAVMKLKSGGYKYIRFSINSNATSPVAVDNRKRASVFPSGSAIGNMKFMVNYPLSYPENPYVYYVTNDNKVWRANVSISPAVETEITSQFIRDGYNEVTAFKYLLPQSQRSADCPASLEKGLAVATFNPSLGKENGGKLEIFTLKDGLTGELEIAKYPTDKELEDYPRADGYQVTMSWPGMGKIVGLDYKKK